MLAKIAMALYVLIVSGFSLSVSADLLNDSEAASDAPKREIKRETPSQPPVPANGKSQKPGSVNSSNPEKTNKTSASDQTNQLPVLFEGAGLKGLRESGMIELLKDVKVTQGDLSLTAESAKVFFDAASGDVRSVEAIGGVEMSKIDAATSQKIKSRSDRAEFDAFAQKILLIGNAELHKGKDVIKGQTIEYDMKSGWIKANKVKGVVRPEER